MRLLAVITWPGWRLRSFNDRLHWAARRKANQPPVRLDDQRGPEAIVAGPHKQRLVEITRFGPRVMDTDRLYQSVSPALDLVKCKRVNGNVSTGYLWDDSPKYCKLVVKQRKGPYEVIVKVYE
jgi:hypothetical protein